MKIFYLKIILKSMRIKIKHLAGKVKATQFHSLPPLRSFALLALRKYLNKLADIAILRRRHQPCQATASSGHAPLLQSKQIES